MAIGVVIYVVFILVGFILLALYFYDYFFLFFGDLFWIICVLICLGFVIVGGLKSYVIEIFIWKGVLEILVLGVLVVGVVYLVGDVFECIIVG